MSVWACKFLFYSVTDWNLCSLHIKSPPTIPVGPEYDRRSVFVYACTYICTHPPCSFRPAVRLLMACPLPWLAIYLHLCVCVCDTFVPYRMTLLISTCFPLSSSLDHLERSPLYYHPSRWLLKTAVCINQGSLCLTGSRFFNSCNQGPEGPEFETLSAVMCWCKKQDKYTAFYHV